MSTVIADRTARYADRIAKLLRKAESTTGPEAEALVEKAQELMTAYAIDEAMIARATGKTLPDRVIDDRIGYTGQFRMALFDIGKEVARANNCRVLIDRRDRARPQIVYLCVVGFESDVERVKLLDASLQVQAQRALLDWYGQQDTSWMSGGEKFKARREFLFGFAAGVEAQLRRAAKAGRDEAVEMEKIRQRDAGDPDAADAASESVALVLRSRKEQVDDWIDERYGKLRKGRSSSRSYGGFGAASAGRAAGASANVGNPSVGGSRGSLGRG